MSDRPASPPEDSDSAATPLMAQYMALKTANPDCLLFFRLGDFYEMFFDDAVRGAQALDIALTRRGQHEGKDIPMCGIPAHACETYLARLIRKGFRVAIAEQMEDPAAARRRGGKSLVTREITRIVTPGTVTEDSLLESRTSNYLASLAASGESLALAWLDLADGTPCAQTLAPEGLAALLERLQPRELLLPARLAERPDLAGALEAWRPILTPQPDSRFDSDNGRRRLEKTYAVGDLAAFGTFSRAGIAALGALLDYAALTQKQELAHLAPPRNVDDIGLVGLDPATRRNLELTRTLQGEREGSLLATLDQTLTGAGARLLAARLNAPLTNPAAINRRLDAVAFFVERRELREKSRALLKEVPDLERALARLGLGRGGPRDLAVVRDAARAAGALRSLLLATAPDDAPDELRQALQALGDHNALMDRLTAALAETLPLQARDGGYIRAGFDPALDELGTLRDDSRRLIANLQQNYAAQSGVATLKIRHNQVIGYHLEVTPAQADKMLARKDVFIHRQSLANAVRFTTTELADLERRITEAASRALAHELRLFGELVDSVLAALPALRQAAGALAELDVTAALAALAAERNYARPMVDDTLAFDIRNGRHPVVEQSLKTGRDGAAFVGNDCDLAPGRRLWLLTGPNMAGKSTFLRQNALIALMAQMGSFVPADAAHIGVVDRLFSRVGAADDLARGRSTFMVEMVETAAILNQAGVRALVILDEIGRGTATWDGLSIAWATLEYLHDTNRCRTLFATHYHELTGLTGRCPELFCATMRIREWRNDIVFLHQVAPGVADRSYGLHVARMAGLPRTVLTRAEALLKLLEKDNKREKAAALAEDMPLFGAVEPQVLAASEPEPPPPAPSLLPELDALLHTLDPDALSPRDALQTLYKIKTLAG